MLYTLAWVYLLYTGRVYSDLHECFEMLYTVKSDQSVSKRFTKQTESVCDDSFLLYILNTLLSHFLGNLFF